MLSIGCTNAYLLARLIVVRVTKEPVARFHIVIIFLFITLVASTLTLSPIFPWNKGTTPTDDRDLNYVLLGVLLGFVFIQWAYFFGSVVRQLSKYLWMPIFTVKKGKVGNSFSFPPLPSPPLPSSPLPFCFFPSLSFSPPLLTFLQTFRGPTKKHLWIQHMLIIATHRCKILYSTI